MVRRVVFFLLSARALAPSLAAAAAPTAAIYGAEEDEDLEAALALSMQPNTSAAAPELSAAVAAPELSEKERLRIERAKRFQSAPSIVRSIDEQVDAAFEKEKNESDEKFIEESIVRLIEKNISFDQPHFQGNLQVILLLLLCPLRHM